MTALDEHPYRFVLDGHRVLRLRHRGVHAARWRPIDDHRHTEVRSTFEGLLAGTIEPDGFNRLVVLAGLTASQANVLRCVCEVRPPDRVHVQSGLRRGVACRGCRTSPACWSSCSRRGSIPTSTTVSDSPPWRRPRVEVLGALDECRRSTTTASGAPSWRLIEATVRTTAYQGKPTIGVQVRSVARCPICRRLVRRTRSSCVRHVSRVCTCVVARSLAAVCAGATGRRTIAPRCSVW